MTIESVSLPVKPRYYLDNGTVNSQVRLPQLAPAVHALFCQWVKAHCHERDFVEALEHTATCIYAHHLLEGTPDFGDEPPEFEHLALEPQYPPTSEVLAGNKLRFYEEDCSLSLEIETNGIRSALASLYVAWAQAGFHLRDFIQAVKDAALCEYHDYDIVSSLNGLGGGRTLDQFLNTAKPVH